MSKYVMYEPTHAVSFDDAMQKGCLQSVTVDDDVLDNVVKRIALAANQYLIIGKVIITTEKL